MHQPIPEHAMHRHILARKVMRDKNQDFSWQHAKGESAKNSLLAQRER
jgi:hypothetical protein